MSQGIAKVLLEKIDEELMKGREEGLRVEGLRERWVTTLFGDIKIRLEVGYDGLRGLGAIEGNVDKLIANRMKKRGMSWTKRGGNRMTRLINLREMGELHS